MKVNFREIHRRRKAMGLTFAEAARRAGWRTPQNWSNVEKGQAENPRVQTLIAVAKVLKCKVDDLLKR